MGKSRVNLGTDKCADGMMIDSFPIYYYKLCREQGRMESEVTGLKIPQRAKQMLLTLGPKSRLGT